MCKLKFYWFKIWMTTSDKNRKKSKSSLKAKCKVERIVLISNCLLFCVLRPTQIYLDRMYCADFARNKITVDVGCVHMLMYNACVWGRLRALGSYNELGLTNHSVFFKRGYFIKYFITDFYCQIDPVIKWAPWSSYISQTRLETYLRHCTLPLPII